MSSQSIHKKNSQRYAVVWFRQDLRLADNPALLAAVASGLPVAPVFILEPKENSQWSAGGAGRWWMHQSLAKLRRSLEDCGSNLILRSGDASAALPALVKECNATHVFWNRLYEPESIARDTALKAVLQESGVQVESFNGELLFEPWEIRTGEGRPFHVFTPYWKACLAAPAPPRPMMAPVKIVAPAKWPKTVELDDLELGPKIDWAAGLRETWTPGEAGAMARLKEFSHRHLREYSAERDTPSVEGTSRLSPHLHFGEISPRQVWHALERLLDATPYLRQIVWREFAHHMLYYYPTTPTEPYRAEFRKFPWRMDAARLQAWTEGKTGYPLVDAGMRELWHTGWMHNRVRMVAASFLVKHLLQPWQEGAAWFWDTLVDADLANNTFGWQWVAGCGADAAPYFRVFNPVLQSRKFDARGDYIRKWVPELSGLSAEEIHEPWSASKEALAKTGVKLGETYPLPLVNHAKARAAALSAFRKIRGRDAE